MNRKIILIVFLVQLALSCIKLPENLRTTPLFSTPNHQNNVIVQGISTELQQLFMKNKMGVQNKVREQPQYFSKHYENQYPKYFWIGCSDSRVSPELIFGFGVGEVFVHRNIANQANPNDTSIIAALEFVINYLKIEHIIVAGHTNCGGVKSAATDQDFGELEPWLEPIRDLKNNNEEVLNGLADNEAQINELIRLNVKEQMINISQTELVKNHWNKGGKLSIHGVVYDLKSGLVQEITTPIRNIE